MGRNGPGPGDPRCGLENSKEFLGTSQVAPQGAPQGDPLRGPIKGDSLRILHDFLRTFWICDLFLNFWVSKPCSLSFSTQNHAESFGNYINKSVLDPKRAKFHQQLEFGHVRTCQG